MILDMHKPQFFLVNSNTHRNYLRIFALRIFAFEYVFNAKRSQRSRTSQNSFGVRQEKIANVLSTIFSQKEVFVYPSCRSETLI